MANDPTSKECFLVLDTQEQIWEIFNALNGGGPGEAVTIADGADVALGATSDPPVTDPSQTASLISINKGIVSILTGNLGSDSPLTDNQLRSSPVPVTTGDLTNTQLRASPVPVVTNTTYTPVFASVGASASSTIPATAKAWSFILLTGTGTLGGTSVPIGVPVNGRALTSALAYTTGTTSSAYIAYET